jgi:hypothetical protein
MLFALIGQHLDSLYHVVRHELGYLKAVDDLPPDETLSCLARIRSS